MNHKKIQASACGEDCTVRIPMVCNHNPETVVLAHVNGVRFGHGVGKKTSFGAYCCSACHDVLDGRVKTDLDRQYLKMAHYEGVMETLCRLEEKGII